MYLSLITSCAALIHRTQLVKHKDWAGVLGCRTWVGYAYDDAWTRIDVYPRINSHSTSCKSSRKISCSAGRRRT